MQRFAKVVAINSSLSRKLNITTSDRIKLKEHQKRMFNTGTQSEQLPKAILNRNHNKANASNFRTIKPKGSFSCYDIYGFWGCPTITHSFCKNWRLLSPGEVLKDIGGLKLISNFKSVVVMGGFYTIAGC